MKPSPKRTIPRHRSRFFKTGSRAGKRADTRKSPNSKACYQALGSTLLGNHWIELLENLPTLGPVMLLSGNPGACIGTYLDISELTEVLDHSVYFNRTIRLEYLLQNWRQSLGVQNKTPSGICYSIDIQDEQGQNMHKVCLTPASSLLNYSRLTELLSTLPPLPEANIPPREKKPTAKELPYGDSITAECVRKLLQHFHENKWPLKATIHNAGLSHQSELRFLKLKDCENSWIYAEGKESGIHLKLGAGLHYVIQDAGHCQPRWKLQILSGNCTPVAELSSVSGVHLPAWNRLFESI